MKEWIPKGYFQPGTILPGGNWTKGFGGTPSCCVRKGGRFHPVTSQSITLILACSAMKFRLVSWTKVSGAEPGTSRSSQGYPSYQRRCWLSRFWVNEIVWISKRKFIIMIKNYIWRPLEGIRKLSMNKKNIQGYFSLRKENELSFACERENNRPSEKRSGVKRPGLGFIVTLGHLCTIV